MVDLEMTTSTMNKVCFINDDVLHNILSKLPVKSLARLKCVSKRLRYLIEDDPHFHDLHIAHSKTRPSLLVMVPSKHDTQIFAAENLFEGGSAIYKTKTSSMYHKVLRPVNGLVCFVDINWGSACIQNLSTREITPWIETTPYIEPKYNGLDPVRDRGFPNKFHFGFGFDPTTKEHKVICTWQVSRYNTLPVIEVVNKVLTVGENTWRRINDVQRDRLSRAPSIYANGSIYRLNRKHEAIVAFHVGSEKFRVIDIPNFIIDNSRRLGIYHRPTLRPHRISLLEIDNRIALAYLRSHNCTMKLWICVEGDDDDDSTERRQKKMINTNWIEETITLPLALRGSNAITGTDGQIVICNDFKARKENGVVEYPYYYYEWKKKTFKEVKITFPPSINTQYRFTITGFAESLFPVSKKNLSI